MPRNKKESPPQEVIVAYKGFEVGKTYEHEGEVNDDA